MQGLSPALILFLCDIDNFDKIHIFDPRFHAQTFFYGIRCQYGIDLAR